MTKDVSEVKMDPDSKKLTFKVKEGFDVKGTLEKLAAKEGQVGGWVTGFNVSK